MTTFIILALLLMVEVPLLFWRLTAGEGLARTGVHMMAYMVVCQIFFFLYVAAVFSNPGDPCAHDAQILIPNRMLFTFGALFALFCAVDMLCAQARGVWANSQVTLISLLRQAGGFTPLVAWTAVIAVAGFVATRNWGILWSNSTYLLMASRNGAINDGGFPSLIASLLSPIYFLACIFLAVALVARRHFEAFLLLASALAIFVIQASGASRSAAVGIFLFCLAYGLLSRRIGWSTILLGLFGIYVFQAVLIGRGMGAFGISNFWSVMAYPLTEGIDLQELLKNVLQGAISTSDGFVVSGTFASVYKWLSLSPLPSFIDGFDQIRPANQIMLHKFCPMSGVTEVILFGPPFWIVAIAEYAAMVVAINSRPVIARTGLLPVLCVNLLLTVFTITGFTYPLRNVLRPMVYACIALVLFAFFSKRPLTFRQPLQPSVRPRPSHGRYFVRPRRTRR